jgi:hypothetical protein
MDTLYRDEIGVVEAAITELLGDASPTGDLTFLITERGKAFTAAGFGNWFRDRCNEAGLPHCSAHGLRKAGATDRQLMAMFDWSTAAQANVYTEAANRKRLAAEASRLMVLEFQKSESVPPESGLPHLAKEH